MNKDKFFHFPGAQEWMWDYCIPLGKFTYKDKPCDLGVFVNDDTPAKPSGAIVFDNENDYASPDWYSLKEGTFAYMSETYRRYMNVLSKVEWLEVDFVLTSEHRIEVYERFKDILDVENTKYEVNEFDPTWHLLKYRPNLESLYIKRYEIVGDVIAYIISDKTGGICTVCVDPQKLDEV